MNESCRHKKTALVVVVVVVVEIVAVVVLVEAAVTTIVVDTHNILYKLCPVSFNCSDGSKYVHFSFGL